MSQARRAFTLLIALTIFGAALRVVYTRARAQQRQGQELNLVGRWRVVVVLGGVKEELILEARVQGSGSFRISGPESNDQPTSTWPAVWSRTANGGVSFSGEAELPLGTCCREMGTVAFKGRFESRDSIAGKVVFVTSIDEDESPFKLRSAIGTFTAKRILEGHQRARLKPKATRA